jgi:hypothetical protein
MHPMQKKMGMRSLMRVPKKVCASRHVCTPMLKMCRGSGIWWEEEETNWDTLSFGNASVDVVIFELFSKKNLEEKWTNLTQIIKKKLPEK